ncbi:MAG: glutamate racemase [Candidatus Hydrogenedentota bacterium]|nr:MAG: glutamate racemase [Candidatus Hydrogenedentota bacterium]
MIHSPNAPIGIFDSGVGGLTVLSAIEKALPSENLLYFGDTARVPYGTKSKDTVIRYSKEIYSFLVDKGSKAIVIACNTASSHALEILQKESSIPVLGVVEPGIRAYLNVAKQGKSKPAVIATRSTVKSGSYEKAYKKLNGSGRLFTKACPLFVPMIEENYMEKKAMDLVIHEYLDELIREEITHVILGCTHYPLLLPKLSAMYPTIQFINPAEEVALELKDLLEQKNLRNQQTQGELKVYVSDITDTLSDLQTLFLGEKIDSIERVVLDW